MNISEPDTRELFRDLLIEDILVVDLSLQETLEVLDYILEARISGLDDESFNIEDLTNLEESLESHKVAINLSNPPEEITYYPWSPAEAS